MIKHLYILLILSFYSAFIFGQKQDTDMSNICLTSIAQVNQGESYITFPTDIGNTDPLWFEANLNPDFYIRTSKNARLIGVLTPQVIIRMYQEESFPVRTPSYMPQITAYYRFSSLEKVNTFSTFFKIAHHSNGQADDFYLADGKINTESGNFSTNYTEFGIIKTNYNKRFDAYQFFSTSFQVHFKDLTPDELIGLYSLYRWNTQFSVFKKSKKNIKKSSISLKGKTTWMFDDINNWDSFSLDRLSLSFTFFYHPKFLEDIGLFAQIYHGMDYYNIYFNQQITVLRFGIMTEKLKF